VPDLRSTILKYSRRLGFGTEWILIVIGAAIGSATGLCSVGFATALHWFEHEVHNVQTRGGALMLIVLPVVGMGATGLLVQTFAKEAKGHGVPQVMRALIQRGGRISAKVGIIKTIASILTVGSGGSAGTEGPIVQIGATLGSVGGQRLGIRREQMGTLVGCGAAAGIASIFNAPIAGVFFVLEIMLRDFSIRSFAPIVVASVFSSATTQALIGTNEAIFESSENLHGYVFKMVELPSYIGLGFVCGLVAVGFNRVLHWGEDLFDNWKINPYLKPLAGAAGLGLLGIAFVLALHGDTSHNPNFYGNGYDTIRSLLRPDAYHSAHPIASGMTILMLLVVIKGIATTLTLASGGSGGVFAPSLFMGATTGAAFGVLLEKVGLMPAGASPAGYALVGMAAVVAATTHGPLTAILILFELTRDIYVLLPIMLAAIVATVIAQIIERDSIYTYKLRRSGVLVGRAADLTLLRRISVRDLDWTPLPPEPVYASDPVSKLIALHAHHNTPDFPVVNADGDYIGMVTGHDIRVALIDREAIPLLLVAELLRTNLPTISRDEHLDTVMDKFSEHDIASLAIVDEMSMGEPRGLITRASLMKRYQAALEES